MGGQSRAGKISTLSDFGRDFAADMASDSQRTQRFCRLFRIRPDGLCVKRVVQLQSALAACYLCQAIHFVLGDREMSQT